MTRLWFCLALVACSCSTAPIAPDVQQQMATIASAYGKARALELDRCPQRVANTRCYNVRRAGYEAEAAFTVASSERTDKAIGRARLRVMEFADAALELR